MRSFSSKALILLLLVAASAQGQDYAPYPRPDAGYVTDQARVLSPAEQERIEQWLLGVEQKSGAEVIVVTIDSIADYPGTENRSLE
ncbi:MAG TPA: TPM domain-containing protein, partial [Thermoanaerobaculia bacterium]|nr:TPM domain-containing protein [Thermoanaerobaculia bacterium]